MNCKFTVVAMLLSSVALWLPTRSQTFTRVAIDGHSMRLLVAGSGPASVVFENGLGPPLEMWGKVQPQVSTFARTVTYDRAGVGLSDIGPSPRDARQIARELRDALRLASVPSPYLLVGASFGGLYIRVFAGMYPEEVSGMVLVDPTHNADNIAASAYPELVVVRDTVEQARASAIPPHVPLVLIDAISSLDVPFTTQAIRTRRAQQWPEVEADSRVYRMSLDTIPGARLIVTDKSGHNVSIEQPDLVVGAIRDVVQQIRDPRNR